MASNSSPIPPSRAELAKAVLLIALFLLSGAAVIASAMLWTRVRRLAGQPAADLPTVGFIGFYIVFNLLLLWAMAGYLIRQGVRVRGAGRFPLPGAPRLIASRPRTGHEARRAGLIYHGAAAILLFKSLYYVTYLVLYLHMY